MPDISIIIPVYNAEKYLKRSMESVLLALDGIKGEILLIDNGSSDKSVQMAKEYQQNYPKMVRALNCKTRGAGAARNYGTKQAHGKYLWFVDADDAIRQDAVKELLDTAKATKADLVMLGMKRIYTDGQTNYLSAVRPDETNYKSRFVRYGMGPVQVLVRRAWWQKYDFKFREEMIHEDMELMSALILYADSYASVDEPLYLYYQNENSVLHRIEFGPQIFDIFPALEGLYGRFKAAGAEKDYHDELEWFFIWNLLIDSAKDFAKFKEGRPGFKRARDMLKEYFPNWRKNKFLKEKPLKTRIRVRLNYLR